MVVQGQGVAMANETAAVGGAPIVHAIKTDGKPQRAYRYRSVRALGYTVLAVELVYVLCLAVQIVALGRLLQQAGPDVSATMDTAVAAGGANALILGFGALVGLAALVIAYVTSAFWIYNTACNARAFGAQNLQVSPGWAVGFYFIPIMSFFKPFQAIEEIWDASVVPSSLRTPLLLRFWWGAWLITNFAGAVTARIPDLPLAVQIAQTSFDVVAVTLFATVVWRITRMQSTRVRDVAQVFA
jgi:hypothetical protein